MAEFIENMYGFCIFAIFSMKWQDFMWDFCILTGFENVVSKIKLHLSSLGCTDTKHRTRYLKWFHSTTVHKDWGLLSFWSRLRHGGGRHCLATNYRRVPIIARQNSNRYYFTKSSIPNLANKVHLFPKWMEQIHNKKLSKYVTITEICSRR